MQIITIILCSIAAPIVFLLLTYWMDRKQPEPLPQLLKALTLGGVVALLSLSFTAVLNNAEWIYVGDVTSWSHFKQAFFGAAFPEEASKLIMLYILLKNNKYFDEFFDGIVYSVFIAMGFASVENICYALTNPEGWQAVLIGRSILSVPAHFCYAVVMGACFSCYNFPREELYSIQPKAVKDKRFLALALIVPIFLHATFDFCLNEIAPRQSQQYMVGLFVVFVLLILSLILFAYLGICGTQTLDSWVRAKMRQQAWKRYTGNYRSIVLVALTSTMILKGEPTTEESTLKLSDELTEFRDQFCLPIRKAFIEYESNKNGKDLSDALYVSLGEFDVTDFINNKMFDIKDRCKIRITDLELYDGDKKAISKVDNKHLEYNPQFIEEFANRLPHVESVAPDMMYELIHKLTTDANAVTATLTQCQCFYGMALAGLPTSYTMNCYGKNELLLVSENGGELQLSITNLTTNEQCKIGKKDGASWSSWEMKTCGPCRITISNKNSKPLSFILASTKKNN